jgi:hypothetical protein
MSSTEPYWSPLVPELTVTSLTRSLYFYQQIGFTTRYQRTDPPFAYLEMGHAQIMLEQEHGEGWNVYPLDRPLGRGINFQIEVGDLASVLTKLAQMQVLLFREPKETWYAIATGPAEGGLTVTEEGQTECLLQDPDGYLLRLAQHLGRRKRLLQT